MGSLRQGQFGESEQSLRRRGGAETVAEVEAVVVAVAVVVVVVVVVVVAVVAKVSGEGPEGRTRLECRMVTWVTHQRVRRPDQAGRLIAKRFRDISILRSYYYSPNVQARIIPARSTVQKHRNHSQGA